MQHELIPCESTHIASRVPDLCRLADAFIASRDVAQSSRVTYRRALKAFFDWLDASGRGDRISQLTRFDILAYKDELGRTKSVSTANMYLFVVFGLYEWLAEHQIHPNITAGVKRFRKYANQAKDCLSIDQLRRILEGIDRRTLKGKRDYAIINLMARTGLREIEVARARVGDIRMQSNTPILWVHGKGRAEADAFVILVPAAYDPIAEWLGVYEPKQVDAPLFAAVRACSAGERMTSRSIMRPIRGHPYSRLTLLRKEYLLFRTLRGTPLPDTPLKRPQLTLLKRVRILLAQPAKQMLGFQPGGVPEHRSTFIPVLLERVFTCSPGMFHAHLRGQPSCPDVLPSRLLAHPHLRRRHVAHS